MLVLIPLLIGVAIRAYWAPVAATIFPWVKKTGGIFLLLCLGTCLWIYGKEMLSTVGSFAPGAWVVFMIVMAVVPYRDRLRPGTKSAQRHGSRTELAQHLGRLRGVLWHHEPARGDVPDGPAGGPAPRHHRAPGGAAHIRQAGRQDRSRALRREQRSKPSASWPCSTPWQTWGPWVSSSTCAKRLKSLRSVRVLGLTLGWSWVVGPALAVLLTKILPMAEPYAVGLLIFSLAPTAPALPMSHQNGPGRHFPRGGDHAAGRGQHRGPDAVAGAAPDPGADAEQLGDREAAPAHRVAAAGDRRGRSRSTPRGWPTRSSPR